MERVIYIDAEIYQLETDLYYIRDSELLVRQRVLQSYGSWDSEVTTCHQRAVASVESMLTSSNVDVHLRDAVLNDRCNIVLIMLRLGANVHCLDAEERTLLHFCTSARMVDALLLYGDDNFLHQKSHAGHSALHNISHVDAARRLLEKGLSANITNNGGCTPLHYVTNPSLIVTLLDFGANPNHVNYYGHTPLHMAASRGIWEVVYYLLLGGCQVSLCGRDGMSAVTLARMVQSTVLGDIDSKKRSEDGAAMREFRRLEKSIELLAT